MTNETSLSYSFATGDPAPSGSGLFAFADCELIPLDSTMVLVINRQNGRQLLVAAQVVEALKTCTTFRTLEAHAGFLARTRPELKDKQALAMQALQQLREADMLLGADRVRERLTEAGTAELAPTRTFIVTCDRPDAVRRLLESLLRQGNLTRQEALVLVDDSREDASRAANREAVESFNLRSARDMVYVGAAEQAALLDQWIAALPGHEAGIRFLIDPAPWTGYGTYGRSRTLCLLLSVGYRAIVLDDDILCQAVLPPLREEGIGLRGERKAAFYPDRDTLMASAAPAPFDPLAGHAEHLGQYLGASLIALNGGPLRSEQFLEANAAMLNVLTPESRVLVTQCGSWGHPGTGSAHWAIHLGEDSIERLVNAPHGMAAALENGCSWLGCAQPTLHKMAFMSQMTGLDNSSLLPPYFPAFRGEDLLFGTMVEAMHHRDAVLEYGWSVPHLPLTARGGEGVRAPMASGGGISLFSRYLAERIDYEDASDPLRQLHRLAEDTRRLASRSTADLILDYRRELARGQAEHLFKLRMQLARAQELPSLNWQGYLKRGVEELQAALGEPHSPTEIHGIPEGSDEGAVVDRFRELATGWAAALDAWPALRERCRDDALPRP